MTGLRGLAAGGLAFWLASGLALAGNPGPRPYPPVARALNLPGLVTLSCTAAADGTVSACRVDKEDPPGWGFGQAALTIGPLTKVAPGAEGRTVQLPVRFQLDDSDLAGRKLTRTPAFAPPPDQVRWASRPSPTDFAVTYPDKAAAYHRAGDVDLACRAAADGSLSTCAVMREAPSGMGFEKAALTLASTLKLAPRLADGRPVQDGVVKLTLHWDANPL